MRCGKMYDLETKIFTLRIFYYIKLHLRSIHLRTIFTNTTTYIFYVQLKNVIRFNG